MTPNGPRETLFALATPPGRGAVAVIRLSGPLAGDTLQALTARPLPPPRQAVLRRLRTPSGEILDEALVLWMPGPGSFTGEDCVELHLHGGPAIVLGVLERLSTLAAPAGPGDFTRRAFENGRLDLSQAEAIGDLVEAETGNQRRQAMAQLGGALSRRYEVWRETLLDALALLEAQIDFPDEDVPEEVGYAAAAPIDRVLEELRAAAAQTRGERVRDGFRIALIGAPNVGKSSLLNALAGREAAIVTPVAGTTRDVVEVPLSLSGQLAVLADTAGLRETHDVIEAEGVRRAVAWAEAADIRIGVVDRTRPETLQILLGWMRPHDILAMNKSDLSASSYQQPEVSSVQQIATTATPLGITALKASLTARIAQGEEGSEFPAVTRLRHRVLLQEASDHLQRAQVSIGRAAELAAEDVRLTVRSLEKVSGRANPEAVLDRVFASFCIGK